jgi:uncharacterized protein (TIGR01777 family)
MEDGARIAIEEGLPGLRRRLIARVSRDADVLRVEARGPRTELTHSLRVLPRGATACELIDHLECERDAGASAVLAGGRRRRGELERVFRFRHARVRRDLDRHARWASKERLTVAIAGAGGLIGSHLQDYLVCAGHDVVRLVRRQPQDPSERQWDPARGRLDPASLHGVDVVVNLAGASLASLWTRSRREALLTSRVGTTRTLAQAIRAMDNPPSVFVVASAVGAYGSRDDEVLTEASSPGAGFLADLCWQWEAASQLAAAAGVRVVSPRFGLVLTASGGVLAAMLPPFRVGLGGRIGDGRQWWSWVALDDLLGALEWMMHDDAMEGIVNVVAPQPCANGDFAKTLAGVLDRPARLRAPRTILERLGGMPREMLLASQRVVPLRLQERGFDFTFPTLEEALRFELGR